LHREREEESEGVLIDTSHTMTLYHFMWWTLYALQSGTGSPHRAPPLTRKRKCAANSAITGEKCNRVHCFFSSLFYTLRFACVVLLLQFSLFYLFALFCLLIFVATAVTFTLLTFVRGPINHPSHPTHLKVSSRQFWRLFPHASRAA